MSLQNPSKELTKLHFDIPETEEQAERRKRVEAKINEQHERNYVQHIKEILNGAPDQSAAGAARHVMASIHRAVAKHDEVVCRFDGRLVPEEFFEVSKIIRQLAKDVGIVE